MYSNKTVVQIGSHVGDSSNDPIYTKIDSTTRLILVEPVPYIFEQLCQNYASRDTGNITFINKAVSNSVGDTTMTIPSKCNDFSKFPMWASQLSSSTPSHVSCHLPELITECIVVETTTIDEIIKEHNITTIDLLHTDTEGHDYDILNSYSFSIKPYAILFEHKHMDGTCIVGKRYRRLCNILKSLGYIFKYKTEEDTMFELGC